MSETKSRLGTSAGVECVTGKSEVPEIKSHLGQYFATGFSLISRDSVESRICRIYSIYRIYLHLGKT